MSIQIIDKTNDDWWYCQLNNKYGYVPTNHVRLKYDEFIDEQYLYDRINMENNRYKYINEYEEEELNVIQQKQDQNETYFDTYSNVNIHLEMLADKKRTLAYKNAIQQLTPYIKDKIVLDVGCGTGILSMFAAKAGAKHVYAVDASDFVNRTRKVINENGLSGIQ